MSILGGMVGLPVSGPLRGLGWLARRIAEAADQEMADPARIEAALLALERELDTGAIDEPTFEAREAELLAELLALQAAPDAGATAEAADSDAPDATATTPPAAPDIYPPRVPRTHTPVGVDSFTPQAPP